MYQSKVLFLTFPDIHLKELLWIQLTILNQKLPVSWSSPASNLHCEYCFYPRFFSGFPFRPHFFPFIILLGLLTFFILTATLIERMIPVSESPRKQSLIFLAWMWGSRTEACETLYGIDLDRQYYLSELSMLAARMCCCLCLKFYFDFWSP